MLLVIINAEPVLVFLPTAPPVLRLREINQIPVSVATDTSKTVRQNYVRDATINVVNVLVISKIVQSVLMHLQEIQEITVSVYSNTLMMGLRSASHACLHANSVP